MKRKRRYSDWIDVGCFNNSGRYVLIQMRYHLRTNKKVFRRSKMGWVNDYTVQQMIYDNAMRFNKD